MAEGEIVLAGEAEMLALGHRLAALVRIGDVIALEGGLGAGKTTLARGILEGLGLEGKRRVPASPSSSPMTFRRSACLSPMSTFTGSMTGRRRRNWRWTNI